MPIARCIMNPNKQGESLPQPTTPRPGLAHRLWTALRRFILGRSDGDYMKQFTGDDAYWDNMLAAERGWPPDPKKDLNHPGRE
jgi:hypothetical protein